MPPKNKEQVWKTNKASISNICGVNNITTAKTLYNSVISTIEAREQALNGMSVAQRMTSGSAIANSFNGSIQGSIDQFKNTLSDNGLEDKKIESATGKIFKAASDFLNSSIGRRDIFPDQRGI